jgi:hypothetical protein
MAIERKPLLSLYAKSNKVCVFTDKGTRMLRLLHGRGLYIVLDEDDKHVLIDINDNLDRTPLLTGRIR